MEIAGRQTLQASCSYTREAAKILSRKNGSLITAQILKKSEGRRRRDKAATLIQSLTVYPEPLQSLSAAS